MTADEFLENVWGLSETGELVLQNLNKPELKKNIQITGGNTRRKTGGKIENIETASPNLFLLKFSASAARRKKLEYVLCYKKNVLGGFVEGGDAPIVNKENTVSILTFLKKYVILKR